MPDTPKEVLPENVELHEFTDLPHWRKDIFDKTLKSVESSFPREYGTVRMELTDLKYSDKKFGPKDEKAARLGEGKLFTPLKGTVVLKDRDTGEELDRAENKTIMSVPYLTDRGTFVHNGSNYTSMRQARLLPGAYSRRKNNGQLEVHYNVKPGSGRAFRVNFEPETSMFRMEIGGSSLKLYSVLKAMGVPDSKIRENWGDEIYRINAEKFDRRDINKLFTKLYPYDQEEYSEQDRMDKIREAIENNIVLGSTMRTTLGES